mmetsp:Transcript_27152/g.43613  ORF Transcript_27152/g.43613 Transcript_27152/m.43613 type:complete len:797 (+) Transcript_27152:3202-5592(+)
MNVVDLVSDDEQEGALPQASGGRKRNETESYKVIELDKDRDESSEDVVVLEAKHGKKRRYCDDSRRDQFGTCVRELCVVVATSREVDTLKDLAAWVQSVPIEQDGMEAVDTTTTTTSGILSEGFYVDQTFPADARSISGSKRHVARCDPVPPRCKCNRPCNQVTVRKHNHNRGRKFWGCSSPPGNRCGFFKWASREEWIITEKDKQYVWSRPPQWPVYPPVVASRGFRAEDITQGRLGDCWLLSALSLLATRQDLVEKLFVSTEPIKQGGPYKIRLFIDGNWKVVNVDDLFPCVRPVDAKKKRKNLKGNEDFLLAFCKSERNQLWVPLLEKAYAKAHGCYNSIHGGYIAEALFDLTGRPTETLEIGTLPEDELYTLLESFHQQGYLIGASCINPGKGSGLVGYHAYSVLRVTTTTLKADTQSKLPTSFFTNQSSSSRLAQPKPRKVLRMIQLRNPWGKHEWRGAFSRKSPEWNPSLRKDLGQTDANDGIFWMKFDDFLAHFSSGTIDVCKAPAVGTSWHLSSFSGVIEPESWWAKACLELDTCGKAAWVHFSIIQPTKRGKVDGDFVYCDVAILVITRQRDTQNVHDISTVIPSQRKIYNWDLMLDAKYTYLILPFSLSRATPETHGFKKQVTFSLRLQTSVSVQTRLKQNLPQAIVSTLHSFIIAHPSRHLACSDCHVLFFTTNDVIILLAVNTNRVKVAKVQFDIVPGNELSNGGKSQPGIHHAQMIPPSHSRILATNTAENTCDHANGNISRITMVCPFMVLNLRVDFYLSNQISNVLVDSKSLFHPKTILLD